MPPQSALCWLMVEHDLRCSHLGVSFVADEQMNSLEELLYENQVNRINSLYV